MSDPEKKKVPVRGGRTAEDQIDRRLAKVELTSDEDDLEVVGARGDAVWAYHKRVQSSPPESAGST